MNVVPIRPYQRHIVPCCASDLRILTRSYLKSTICLYLWPWMWWLDILGDEPPRPQDYRYYQDYGASD